jgi:DNA-binding transcriptional LysR family regulator
MDLTALTAFNLVASQGGFGKASRKSGLPKATLSRHVRALERSLGVRLIERGSRALRLTDEGAVLHARTELPLAEIEQTTQDVRSGLSRPSGKLRVSAPVMLSHLIMGRTAATFIARYPEVELEVIAEDRKADIVDDRYDIVIRINPTPEDTLVGRRFFRERPVLVAPRSMKRPPARGPDSAPPVVQAVVLSPRPDGVAWKCLDAEGREFAIQPRAVLRFSSPLLVRDAVCAGAGAALLPPSAVRNELERGELVTWGTAVDGEIEGWVLHASRRLVSPKVSAFVAHLCEALPEGVL